MSTFSGLNTAYTGLVAARQGLDVVGQNISNVNTDGYTRQRVSTSSVGATANTGLFTTGVRPGQGVTVDGIARLGNIFLDARVRSSAAAAGYSAVRANALVTLETSLHEPGAQGISSQLQAFWASWGDLSNTPGGAAQAGVVLEQASGLVAQIAHGYQEVGAQWTSVRTQAEAMVSELNDAGSQVAEINARIRSTLAAGGNINELVDKRNVLTTTIAAIAGGTVRELGDGNIEVLIGGNALVTGDSFRPVALSGAQLMNGAASSPVQLEWAHRPGSPVALDGGELAGALSILSPASGGAGGPLAEAAESYNLLAQKLAVQVNAVHQSGASTSGATGLDFFVFNAALPPALGLTIVPTDGSGLATGTIGEGGNNGSIADAIAQLGKAADSPDALWSAVVTKIGVATRSELRQASLSDLSANSAINSQLSGAGVDIDEENVNLLSFQRAYQGAARVMTAVDEMLDTLINRMGLVGR